MRSIVGFVPTPFRDLAKRRYRDPRVNGTPFDLLIKTRYVRGAAGQERIRAAGGRLYQRAPTPVGPILARTQGRFATVEKKREKGLDTGGAIP